MQIGNKTPSDDRAAVECDREVNKRVRYTIACEKRSNVKERVTLQKWHIH